MTRLPREHYRVLAKFDVGSTIVRVCVDVPWFFKDVKRRPPDVYCLEEWMRVGPDWHNGPPLCWVLHDLWRDVMSWKGKPVELIVSEGQEMLLKGARNLINRHYLAHRKGLKEWPDDWPFWGHFNEGIREYRRGKRARRYE